MPQSNIKSIKSVKFALLGGIPKGDKEKKSFNDWKKEYINKIRKAIPQAIFLSGDLINDAVGPELVVGHDLWMVEKADLIIVNANAKVGVGTGQEIVLAKYNKKPVISIMARDSYNRRSNISFNGKIIKDWVHPFLFISSDFIAENLEEAINWIKDYLSDPQKIAIKDFQIFQDANQYFKDKLDDIVKNYKKQGW